MTINKAFEDLIASNSFKEKAKQKDKEGSKHRVFLSRYRKGELKTGAMVDLLIEHGYKIDIQKR